MEPFLGQLMLFGGNFAPSGWAFCNGQLLSIAEYEALFSLLGTTYGGDGVTTFALPDLRGRMPIGSAAGTGLSTRDDGEAGGSENVTLLPTEIPPHVHLVGASDAFPESGDPSGRTLAAGEGVDAYASAGPDVPMASGALGATGGAQPVPTVPPILVMNWCIALEGIYPSRS